MGQTLFGTEQRRANLARLDSQGLRFDEVDADLIGGYRWYINNGYVYTKVGGKPLAMHRMLMGVDGMDVDHANGDRLDNRRANLRPATRSQNSANRKQREGKRYKGTTPAYGKFRAYGSVGNKTIHLGTFTDEASAARAYDDWATATHGEFAYLNFGVAA